MRSAQHLTCTYQVGCGGIQLGEGILRAPSGLTPFAQAAARPGVTRMCGHRSQVDPD